MAVLRRTGSIALDVSNLMAALDEIKNKQFIGSNQIVMYPYENSSTWDVTLQTNRSGQTPTSPGWNVAIVTAQTVGGESLVADIFVSFSINMPMGGSWVQIPQPANRHDRMQWYVPVFNTRDAYVSLKAQIIANTPVTITAEEGY